ncbi:uncharacterized protein LOC111695876 [Eurytemora carolleeae]|uniref:uncharacterized protein LOC111695876 n=1 Tax=Eurytemora carolleeae TaxID=1294199 RepID=UPI000C7852BA|nr:uncharacterized protein LOC111695876 [Eurytemora carolleeae]|eukprot:XP_023321109.1 uncharacterized protein LOC111695876 [Eurytemora affinis]
MPIRSRLQNTGLKLKIPVRNSSNFNPYTSTRHSSSPKGREGSDGRDGSTGRPRWPSNSPARTKTVKFDASVDNRPVWEMETEKSPNFSDDFRAIPIQIVRNKTTVNILACDNSNIKPPSGASRLFIPSSRPSWTTRPRTTGRTCESEPSSPIFDLTPSPVLLRSRGSKARLKSRNFERRDEGRIEDKALHLLDWFHKLSPQIQNQHKTKSRFNSSFKEFKLTSLSI